MKVSTKSKKKSTKKSKTNNEVSRILHNNMHRLNIEEKSNFPFLRNFLFSLIEEQDEEGLPSSVEDEPKTPQDFTPEQNQKDLEQSLDPNTDPSKFDVEGISPEHSVQHIEKILKWSEKLNEFAKFLNSPTEESLHKILANNDRSGSLLKGVTRKASDSITRITGEIEKLKAVLDTYINTAPKKLRDQDSIKLAG
jgi:uncharacterized membrane-anchored protein YjiN (DUF445 family)